LHDFILIFIVNYTTSSWSTLQPILAVSDRDQGSPESDNFCVHQTHLGDRSFCVAGPCLWNSLPVAWCDRDISLVQFKRLLKTLWFV